MRRAKRWRRGKPDSRTKPAAQARGGVERGLRRGFLGLTLERSFRTRGFAQITCLAPCECAPAEFDAHSAKKYTYSQRAPPRWAVTGPDGVCDVRVHVSALAKGRIMVQALTFSAPLPGNKSVDTNTLYSLLGTDE